MRAVALALLFLALIAAWRVAHVEAPPEHIVERTTSPVGEPRRVPPSGRTISILRSPQGYFVTDASVRGTSLRFVVDTGATRVALGREDARRLGVLPMRYSEVAHTAMGTLPSASVILPSICL